MPGRKKPATAAEQSALDALQADYDRERLAWTAERHRLGRALEAAQARAAELEAELARTAARTRELEAQLRARGS
jgi:hypothetical protein